MPRVMLFFVVSRFGVFVVPPGWNALRGALEAGGP